MRVRVIDLDGVGEQPPVAAANPLIVPARDLAPRLRLWAGRGAMAEAAARLAPVGGEGPCVTFLGSGDFHHLAPLLMAQACEPLTLIHLDNHPDWVKLAPAWHCGAWVNRALELPAVRKVITIGPTSADIDRPGVSGGAFAALRTGRIELFPWSRPPSRLFRHLEDGPGHTVRRGRIHWRCLDQEPWPEACEHLVARAETEEVWVSLDKDVLRPEDAVTNWDQGRMPLDALETFLKTLGRRRRIVGVDICGDWSAPVYDTVLKAWEASLDQPHRPPGDPKINARTNGRLLQALGEAMA